MVGTVGVLQFDVIQYRLEHEYLAKCRFDNLSRPKHAGSSDNVNILTEFIRRRPNQLLKTKINGWF